MEKFLEIFACTYCALCYAVFAVLAIGSFVQAFSKKEEL